MIKENCVVCMHPITNPICEKCYTKEIELWLDDMNIDEKMKKSILREIKKQVTHEHVNESECIICNHRNVDICSYCFFLAVSRALKKIKLKEKIIEEFYRLFNYPEIEYEQDVFIEPELKVSEDSDYFSLDEDYYFDDIED